MHWEFLLVSRRASVHTCFFLSFLVSLLCIAPQTCYLPPVLNSFKHFLHSAFLQMRFSFNTSPAHFWLCAHTDGVRCAPELSPASGWTPVPSAWWLSSLRLCNLHLPLCLRCPDTRPGCSWKIYPIVFLFTPSWQVNISFQFYASLINHTSLHSSPPLAPTTSFKYVLQTLTEKVWENYFEVSIWQSSQLKPVQ